MNKVDHVFHSIEALGTEIYFDPEREIVGTHDPKTSLKIMYFIKEFGGIENLAKFLAHKFGVKYNEPRN